MMNNVLIFIMIISQVAFKVQTVSWGGFLPEQSSIDSILLVVASAPPILRKVLLLYINFHMLLMQLFQERCLRPPVPSYLPWPTTCSAVVLSPLMRSVSLSSRPIPSNPKTVNLHGVSHLFRIWQYPCWLFWFQAELIPASSLGPSTWRMTPSIWRNDSVLISDISPHTSTLPARDYWGINQSIRYGTSTTILSTTAGIVDTGNKFSFKFSAL